LSFAARDQVVVQAAMLAVGSFEPKIMRALMGRSRSAGRYCALEGVRAVRVLADLVPSSVDAPGARGRRGRGHSAERQAPKSPASWR